RWRIRPEWCQRERRWRRPKQTKAGQWSNQWGFSYESLLYACVAYFEKYARWKTRGARSRFSAGSFAQLVRLPSLPRPWLAPMGHPWPVHASGENTRIPPSDSVLSKIARASVIAEKID